MTEGLLFVYSSPGDVSEAEFHDWYDNEHGPARLTVPGIRNGYRFRALDDLAPEWLATYDLDIEALGDPAYKAIVAGASDRERSVKSRLAVLDRRVYKLVSDSGAAAASAGPPPAVLAVAMSVPAAAEAELDGWYSGEHIPMLLEVPGWRRVRRFRLTEGDGPRFLALHEIDGPSVFQEAAYLAAVRTPWRQRVVGSAVRRERRLFGFRGTFG